jgi:hypothetical protein
MVIEFGPSVNMVGSDFIGSSPDPPKARTRRFVVHAMGMMGTARSSF